MKTFFQIYVILLLILASIDAKNKGINNPIAFIIHVLIWLPLNFIIGLQILFGLVVGWVLIGLALS